MIENTNRTTNDAIMHAEVNKIYAAISDGSDEDEDGSDIGSNVV